MTEFQQEILQRLDAVPSNERLLADARAFTASSIKARYSYNFAWQGRPIIQYPQDIVAMQEIVWTTRPDLIIETGIAHGGSLVLSASLLALLDYQDAAVSGKTVDPKASKRRVVGVDIDIRKHNREAILSHPLASRIDMLQGSSVAEEIIDAVKEVAQKFERVMVCLDSNHTHQHVLYELQAYAPLVTKGCYCIVFDTIVEHLDDDQFPDRPWGVGNNPMTAVEDFISNHPEFCIDTGMDSKLLVSAAPRGFLKRVG